MLEELNVAAQGLGVAVVGTAALWAAMAAGRLLLAAVDRVLGRGDD